MAPVKTFIGFPMVKLLGQYVDGFGLIIDSEKLEAIEKLQFPTNLWELDI